MKPVSESAIPDPKLQSLHFAVYVLAATGVCWNTSAHANWLLNVSLNGPVTAAVGEEYSLETKITNWSFWRQGSTTATLALADGVDFVAGQSPGGFQCSEQSRLVTCVRNKRMYFWETDLLTINLKAIVAGNSPSAVSVTTSTGQSRTSGTVYTEILGPTFGVTLSGPEQAVVGSSYVLHGEIGNSGVASYGTTMLYAELPDGVEFVQGESSGGFGCWEDTRKIICARDSTFAEGETDVVQLSMLPTTLGSKSVVTSLSGGGSADVINSNTVTTEVVADGGRTPDLSLSLASPAPTLAATALSQIAVTVRNIGADYQGDLAITVDVLADFSVPLKFARNNDEWICLGDGKRTTCASNRDFPANAESTFKFPLRPAAHLAGNIPSAITAKVAPVSGESAIANNTDTLKFSEAVSTLSLPTVNDPLYSKPLLDASAIPKFAQPLANPLASYFKHTPKANDAYPGADFYTLDIQASQAQVLPDGFPATEVFSYGDPARPDTFTYPAHTIEARSTEPSLNHYGAGKTVRVQYLNTLNRTTHLLPVDHTIHGADKGEPDIRSIAHLHGAKVIDESSDGWAEAWFSPTGQNGGQFMTTTPTVPFNPGPFEYKNRQEATLQWYHDHSIGLTRLNVYAGLAGLYLLRDDNEMRMINSKQLPVFPYEVPIVIQDRMLHPDGSLAYPDLDPDNPAAPAPVTVQPEFFGDVIVVNGSAWPYLEVEPRKYRFRILNGSNSRFYQLSLSDGASFQIIGTEGGFLNGPVWTKNFVMGPAERYDIIIDFAHTPPGSKVVLTNSAPTPFPDGVSVISGLTDQILQFRVDLPKAARPEVTLPTELRPAAVPALTPTAGTAVRQVTLLEFEDEFDRVLPKLGTVTGGVLGWLEAMTELPKAGTVEEWEIYNTTVDAHPIHLHGGHFQIINRQAASWTQDVVSGKLTDITMAGSAADPAPWERNWKETVLTYPGEVTRIRVQFENAGLYVWHCHIVEHEDHDMMRPLWIQP